MSIEVLEFKEGDIVKWVCPEDGELTAIVTNLPTQSHPYVSLETRPFVRRYAIEPHKLSKTDGLIPIHDQSSAVKRLQAAFRQSGAKGCGR